MVFNFFRRKNNNAAIVNKQYITMTGAARRVEFYSQMNVPDTVMGRFEMMTVHMVLYLRATSDAQEGVEGVAQGLVDAFFEDIDHSIRELGIGDVGVPKRMKKLARMFYGRGKTYGEALDNDDQAALEEALKRNIFPEDRSETETDDVQDLNKLAAYVLKADKYNGDVDLQKCAAGDYEFCQI